MTYNYLYPGPLYPVLYHNPWTSGRRIRRTGGVGNCGHFGHNLFDRAPFLSPCTPCPFPVPVPSPSLFRDRAPYPSLLLFLLCVVPFVSC